MNWHKYEGDEQPTCVYVGDRFLVLIRCVERNGKWQSAYWDSHVIVAAESGWDTPDGNAWTAWDWSDVEWYIRLDKSNLPPLTPNAPSEQVQQ